MTTLLDAWIERIRSTDPMTFEDAYFGDRPQGPEVLNRLIRELHAAADGYTRGKFCELLGEMGDTSTIAVLAPELNHPDERVAQWAGLAVEQLKGGPVTQESVAEYRARFAGAPPKND